MGLCVDLVIRDILISHGVENVPDNHGLYVVEQNEEPHCDESDGEAVTDKEDRLVFQGVTNGDGSNGESRVGENHGPPTQVEVDSP